MPGRRRLPNRRPSVTVDLEHAGIAYAATIGFDAEARAREIFCRARRPDSRADLIGDDDSVLPSLLLQDGIAPADLGRSIGRLQSRAASIAGSLVDIIADMTDAVIAPANALVPTRGDGHGY